jgi:ribosomal protein S18 acetylase RimI-like enzyme
VEPPRSARGAPADELLELAQLLRRELIVREEGPIGDWLESFAERLRSGETVGWYYPLAAGGGLASRTEREGISFAHVHVGPGPDGLERAEALTTSLLDPIPSSVSALCVGFTGLPTEEEDALLGRLARRPGSTVIHRFAMERALTADDGKEIPPLPAELAQFPVREVTPEALADLDERAFRGTTDELLLGPGIGEYRRALNAMLDGELGPFLDHASSALYRAEPPALVGAILTSERSARHAVFLDFMVDPGERGHGYGRYLLRWGFRTLYALGYERVRLWVTETNTTARRLYDSVGFSVTLRAVIYRWDRASVAPQPHSER